MSQAAAAAAAAAAASPPGSVPHSPVALTGLGGAAGGGGGGAGVTGAGYVGSPRSSSLGSPRSSRRSGGSGGSVEEEKNPVETVRAWWKQAKVFRGRVLDRLAPHQLYRWGGFVVGLCVFLLRMFYLKGFYIVTYVLFIYLLNQFILFLQPKDRYSLIRAAREREAEDGPTLPTADGEEFRPFVRRLPEFRFWYSSSRFLFWCFAATFFPLFDIPVFWPVLVVYFAVLFLATMRRQWLDMKALRYVPWDIGKKTYRSDPKKIAVKKNDPASAALVVSHKQPPPPGLTTTSTRQGPAPPAPPPVPTMSPHKKLAPQKKSAQD